MQVTGIIAEYNPLHNGHIHHITKAREITNCDLLVCVMTGNYNQRGDLSIIDKFEKTKAALEHGVDLVVELPYAYTLQNAYVYGREAIRILKMLDVDNVVFGSETGNMDELKKYAELEVDVTRLKELMHDGKGYPEAYGLLSSSLYPNDILAVAYLKALKKTKIQPFCIKRTSDYKSKKIDTITSASAIRNAIKNKRKYSNATPLKIKDPIFNDSLYDYLRKLLFTMPKKELSEIFLVSEGIENLLVKNAIKYDSYEEFIDNSVTKRYTRSRIQRVILQIINQIRKKDIKNLKKNNYVRVLGFNAKGQEYLKKIKKKTNVVTQFKNIPEGYKEIEWKTSLVYASLTKDYEGYLKKELKGPIIRD